MPGIGSCGEAPKRESQVQDYLSRCERAIKELSEQTVAMESRLSTVIRQEPASPTPPPNMKAECRETLVPTADRLRALHEQITQCSAHIESICERVEA